MTKLFPAPYPGIIQAMDFFALGEFPALGRKPGYPLVSFLPMAKQDTASIPCAGQMARSNDLAIWPLLYGRFYSGERRNRICRLD
jgi:hypothetical protein